MLKCASVYHRDQVTTALSTTGKATLVSAHLALSTKARGSLGGFDWLSQSPSDKPGPVGNWKVQARVVMGYFGGIFI